MSYTTKTWINGAAGATPLNATGLNDLETRINNAINTAYTDLVNKINTGQSTSTVEFSTQLTGELIPRFMLNGDGTIYTADAPMAITNVTFVGTTVTVTIASTGGYNVADVVVIAGVSGLTNVNGTQTVVTRPTATTFTFTASGTPVGTYTSGGQVQRRWGGHGFTDEGSWNLIAGLAGGISLRSSPANTGNKPLIIAKDYLGAPIYSVNIFGGTAVYGDNACVFSGSDIFNPLLKMRYDGTMFVNKGDAGSGAGVLTLGDTITPPSTQPDGTHTYDGHNSNPGVILMSKTGHPYCFDWSGNNYELGTLGTSRRTIIVAKDFGANTITTVGGPAATISGTGTAANADNPLVFPMVALTTGATSGNAYGISPASYAQTVSGYTPSLFVRIFTDASIANIRLWVGFFSAAPDAISSPTGITCAAFRYDTGVDGTAFWRTVTSAASATPTVTTTTAAIATSSFYDLRIEYDHNNASIRFVINDVVVATDASATRPFYNTTMAPAVRLTTLTNAARTINFCRSVLLTV